MTVLDAKCWVIRNADGKVAGLKASPDFTLADLDDDQTVSLMPLTEAVAEFLKRMEPLPPARDPHAWRTLADVFGPGEEGMKR